MFKKPATPRDLLENIKLGMEQNVFLREDFYTEDNIRQVLGNYPFRWETNDSKRKYLTIEPNAQPLPSSDSNHHCIFGSVLSWQIKAGSEAAPLVKQYLSLSLKHDDPRCAAFSADSMQNLFGKPAKIENIYPPIGPPNIHRVIVPGPATHPLGNTDIEYILDEGVVSKRLNLEIRGNGVVTQFHLSMEQK